MADLAGLPQNLTRCTAAQIEAVIEFFVTLKLSDIRRRQEINQSQTGAAYKQRNLLALGNLQLINRWLAEAVDRKEFS